MDPDTYQITNHFQNDGLKNMTNMVLAPHPLGFRRLVAGTNIKEHNGAETKMGQLFMIDLSVEKSLGQKLKDLRENLKTIPRRLARKTGRFIRRWALRPFATEAASRGMGMIPILASVQSRIPVI